MRKNSFIRAISLILVLQCAFFAFSDYYSECGYPGKVAGDSQGSSSSSTSGGGGSGSSSSGGAEGDSSSSTQTSTEDGNVNCSSTYEAIRNEEVELLDNMESALALSEEAVSENSSTANESQSTEAKTTLTSELKDTQQETLSESSIENETDVGDSQVKKDAAAPKTEGDPVFISSGMYFIEDIDSSCRYGKNTFRFQRNSISSVHPNGALGTSWSCSIDSRIIRGTSSGAVERLNKLSIHKEQILDLIHQLDKIIVATTEASEKRVRCENVLFRIEQEKEVLLDQKFYLQECELLNQYSLYGPYEAAKSIGENCLIFIFENGGAALFEYNTLTKRYEINSPILRNRIYITSRGDGGKNGFVAHYCNGIEKGFNKWGLPEYVQDQFGSRIDFIYDDATNKLSSIIHKNETLFSFAWNEDGLLAQVINEKTNDLISYRYENRLLTSMTDENSDIYQFAYDSDGDIVRLIKPDDNNIRIEYGTRKVPYSNAIKKVVTEVHNEESAGESFVVDSNGNALVYTDADGFITSYTRDEDNCVVCESYPDGTQVTHLYDETNRVISKTTPFGTARYMYDDTDNVIEIAYGDGTSERWMYGEPYNSMRSYTDRDGVSTYFVRDDKGSCVSIVRGGRTICSAEMNEWGGVESVRGIYGDNSYEYNRDYLLTRDKNYVYTYDSKQRVVKRRDVEGNEWNYSYSDDGKVVSSTNPFFRTKRIEQNNRKDVVRIVETDMKTKRTIVKNITYDKCHRPVGIRSGIGSNEQDAEQNSTDDETIYYSAAGKMIKDILWNSGVASIHDGDGICTECSYDGKGAVISKSCYVLDNSGERNGDAHTTTYSYAYRNGLKEIRVSSGLRTVFTMSENERGEIVRGVDGAGRSVTNKISPAGKRIEETNWYGGKTRYFYDEATAQVSRVDSYGITFGQYTYGEDGRIASVSDADGFTKSYVYSEQNGKKKIEERTPASCRAVEYDALGRMTISSVATDGAELLVSHSFTYDNENRTCTGNSEDGTATYDAWNNVLSDSKTTCVYEYDKKGRCVVVTQQNDGVEFITTYSYNAMGSISQIACSDGSCVDYFYNACDQLVKKSDSEGIIWSGSYDDVGNLVSESGRLLPLRQYTYDEGNRLVQVKEAGEVIQSIRYADDLRTVRITDAKGNTEIQLFDKYGMQIANTNRMGKTDSRMKDYTKNTLQYIDYAGNKTTYSFDKNKLTALTTFSDNTYRLMKYDAANALVQAENEQEITKYTYNQIHKLSEALVRDQIVEYTYDELGRKRAITSGKMVDSFSYDQSGRIIFAGCNEFGMTYTYDGGGNLLSATDKNGNRTIHSYDKAGREVLVVQEDKHGTVLFGEGVVFDENGRIVCKTDHDGNCSFFSYDAHGRIAKSNIPFVQAIEDNMRSILSECGDQKESPMYEDASILNQYRAKIQQHWNSMNVKTPVVNSGQKFWTEQYEYDANGNCISKKTPVGTIVFEYDAENRLVKMGTTNPIIFTYDDNGNITQKNSVYRLEEYTYTKENRIRTCTITTKADGTMVTQTYDYDILGRRSAVKKADGVTMRTLYDGLTLTKLMEYPQLTGVTNVNTIMNQKIRYKNVEDVSPSQNAYQYSSSVRYFMSVNGALSFQVANDKQLSFCTDSQGTIRSVMDTSGNKVCSVNYTVSGTPFVNTPSLPATDFLPAGSVSSLSLDTFFCGKQFDATTSWYNFGYRDYDTTTGRFTTLDPIRDGLNWYAYCNGDAVNFFDRDGLWTPGMGEAVRNHADEKYIVGDHDCDVWVEKVVTEANPNSSLSKDWGPAKDASAEDHRQTLEKDLKSEPDYGTNVAIQILDKVGVHAFLVSKNPDGTYDVAQCTRNPDKEYANYEADKEAYGTKSGFSQNMTYKDYDSMEKGWGGLLFYPLNDASNYSITELKKIGSNKKQIGVLCND